MKTVFRYAGSGLALGVLTALFSFTLYVGAETSTTTSTTTMQQQTETTCTQSAGKWCKNSDGKTGWCSQSQSYTCPAYDEPSCKMQGGQWCTSSGGGSAWCSTGASGCPISDEPSCTAKGYKWCKNASSGSGGSSGWCTQSKDYICPAYDEPSCKTQGGDWCQSTAAGSTALAGWCAQNGSTCPVSDEASCKAKSRSWCKYQSGSGGWCANTTEKCPAYDATTCKVQGGDWCQSSSTTTGWCAQGSSTCPVNDEPTCTAKGRPWCKNSTGSGGWCANSGEKCGGTTTYSWPQDEKECVQYKGNWCQSSGGSPTTTMSAYCVMGTMKCSATMSCWNGTSGSTCPAMPSTKTECETQKLSWCTSSSASSGWCSKMPCSKQECEKKSYYWCESTAAATTTTSGWCSESLCMKMPPTGKMTCPDGLSFAAILSECPKGEVLPDTKQCDDGTIVKKDAACPKKNDEKICKGGVHIAVDKECPPEKISDEQIKKNEEQKKYLLKTLSELDQAFQKQKYDDALTQATVVRESIQKVNSESVSAWDDLKAFQASITALEVLRKERDISTSKEKEQEALQQKALEKLKRDMLSFQTKIIGIQDRISRDKRKKITIPNDLENQLSAIKSDVAKIIASTQYDEARELTENLEAKMNSLNTLLDELTTAEQLLAFAPLFRVMDGEITNRQRAIKTFQSLSKSSREIVSELVAAADKKVQGAKDALASARKGSYGEYEDPFDYLEESVVFVLEDVDNDVDTIRASLGLRSYVSKAKVKLAGYKRKVSRDTAASQEVKNLLSTFEEKFTDLSNSMAKKVFPKDQSLQKLIGEVVDVQDAIEKELGLLKETSLEKKLRELKSSQDTKPVELPELDKLVSYADHIRFFLTSHAPVIVYGKTAWDRSYLVKK